MDKDKDVILWAAVNATKYLTRDQVDEIMYDINSLPPPPVQPERPWVGLTDDEISALSKGHMTRNGFARNIEQALKEKNNG